MENVLRLYGEELSKSLSSFPLMRHSEICSSLLHNFRVTVKRTKTLIRLIDFFLDQPQCKKILDPLHDVYKASGVIRDIYIQLNFLKKIENEYPNEAKGIVNTLKRDGKMAEGVLLKTLKKIDVERWKKMCDKLIEITSIKVKDIKPAVCFKLIGIEHQSIVYLLSKEQGFEQLHEVRKRMKIIFYMHELLYKHDKTTSIYSKQLKEINHLQEKLGEMNDWVIFEKKINHINAHECKFPGVEWIAGVQKNKLRTKVMFKLAAAGYPV